MGAEVGPGGLGAHFRVWAPRRRRVEVVLEKGGRDLLQGGPLAVLCADGSLHALDPGGGAVGFHALPPLDGGGLVEL
ncbi:MAG: hypothetical protein ABR562_09420, partial [Thermoplasmatota archaeon]